MKKLYFLLLFGQMAMAQQYTVPTPTALTRCDDDSDGVVGFDLTVKNSEVLGNIPPANLTISYFETSADALANTNAIAQPTSYHNTSNPQTLYVRINNLVNPANFGTTTLVIVVYPSLVIHQPPNVIIYQNPFTGFASFDLNRQTNFMIGLQSGVFAPVYATQSDAEADVNRINLDCFVNTSNPQTLWGREYANFEGGCYHVMSFTLTVSSDPNPNPVIVFPDANFKAKLLQADTPNTTAKNVCGQNMKIDSNSDGEIEIDEADRIYTLNVDNSNIGSLEGITNFQHVATLFCSNNHIQNLNLDGMQRLTELICSYNSLTSLDLSQTKVYNLFCDNNNITYINLKNGIDEQIAPEYPWNYWANNPLAFVCADAGEVEGIEFLFQLNALPNATVSTDCSLSVNENQLVDTIKLFPNPARDILNVKCNSSIKSIQLIDVQGRILVTKSIEGTETTLDVATYSKGVYFIKITTENGSKTERFVKK